MWREFSLVWYKQLFIENVDRQMQPIRVMKFDANFELECGKTGTEEDPNLGQFMYQCAPCLCINCNVPPLCIIVPPLCINVSPLCINVPPLCINVSPLCINVPLFMYQRAHCLCINVPPLMYQCAPLWNFKNLWFWKKRSVWISKSSDIERKIYLILEKNLILKKRSDVISKFSDFEKNLILKKMFWWNFQKLWFWRKKLWWN